MNAELKDQIRMGMADVLVSVEDAKACALMIVAKRKDTKVNPVRKGAQARRAAAKAVREQRNEYFRQQAIEKAIEKSREKKLREEQK